METRIRKNIVMFGGSGVNKDSLNLEKEESFLEIKEQY